MKKPVVPAIIPPADTPPANAIPLAWVKVSHHSPEHLAPRYLYAAYGSNLNLTQMARRCPDVQIHGAGVLRGARLVFAKYLGIEADTKADCPVGVYRCTAADIRALDRYEGFPRSYQRYLVTVEVNGQAVRCFTYIKSNHRAELPSDFYWATCLEGYRQWSFEDRRLRHARARAAKEIAARPPEPPKPAGNHSKYAADKSDPWRGYEPVAGGGVRYVARGQSGQGDPVRSLVTGRMIKPRALRIDERLGLADFKRSVARSVKGDPDAGETFVNPRDGAAWVKDENGTWRRTN